MSSAVILIIVKDDINQIHSKIHPIPDILFLKKKFRSRNQTDLIENYLHYESLDQVGCGVSNSRVKKSLILTSIKLL